METRILNEKDSLEELTSLIHRSYRQLADLGFRYWGTHQSVEDTKKRISNGECYIVINQEKIIGTILLTPPNKKTGTPWYDCNNVSTFHQFAIDPNYQRQGLGSKLLDAIETRAIELGATELACDTAEGATHLINMYLKRGYRQIGMADWDMTNYKSIILSKTIA